MWQEIAVTLIGCVTAGCLVYRIIRLVKTAGRPHNPCDACKGCALKKN